MFERFTERARRVVVLAQEEARLLDHNYIGTEHLLLGLIREGEGVAAKVLAALGISLDAVREQVIGIVGRGEQPPSGHVPFTPRAKKVLALSLREATQLGHNYIGTEHILLGLIREGEGVAARVLTQLGADLDRTRQQAVRMLHGYQAREPAGSGSPARPTGAEPARGFDALRDRLDAIAGQLDAIGTKLDVGAEPRQAAPEPPPETLRQLDQRVEEIRAEKERAIDAQEFERAVTLRNEERELLAQRDAEQRRWLAGAEQRQSAGPAAAELDRLRQVVSSLQEQLRSHGIEPDADPPASPAVGG
jgi:ATP-dependent Clp protease ATP-binding subunit ClpA